MKNGAFSSFRARKKINARSRVKPACPSLESNHLARTVFFSLHPKGGISLFPTEMYTFWSLSRHLSALFYLDPEFLLPRGLISSSATSPRWGWRYRLLQGADTKDQPPLELGGAPQFSQTANWWVCQGLGLPAPPHQDSQGSMISPISHVRQST